MRARETFRWLADHLPFVPDLPSPSDDADRHDEQHVSARADRAVQRANRVIAEINEALAAVHGEPDKRNHPYAP